MEISGDIRRENAMSPESPLAPFSAQRDLRCGFAQQGAQITARAHLTAASGAMFGVLLHSVIGLDR